MGCGSSALSGGAVVLGTAIALLAAPAVAKEYPYPPSIAVSESDCYDSDGYYAYTCSADFSANQQVYATVTNGRESPETAPTSLTVTLSGTGSLSGQSYGYVYSTFGVTGDDDFAADSSGTEPPSYAAGGSLTITNYGDFTMYSMVASNIYFTPPPGQYDDSPLYQAWGGGAIVGLSVGAEGFSEKSEQGLDPNFDGGDGGAVTIFNQGFVSIGASGAVLSYDSTTLPAMANAIGAFSIGGDGWGNRTDTTDHAGDGGDGGTVTVTNNSQIVVNNLTQVYGGQTSPPANAIFAVSQGGIGNIDNSDAPYGNTGGTGGAVTVTNAGDIGGGDIGTAIGIFAVSVGGNSNQFTRSGGASSDKTSFAGNGGPVQVILDDYSEISLETQGPALGVMAISAGGYADNNRQGMGGTSTVTIGDNATVSTSGGSLSIGVLAISAGTLADISPYTTGEVNTAYPGTPGTVTVTNNGSVTSTGQMAVGIAGVSVGGTAIVTNGDAYGYNVVGNAADSYGGFSGSTVKITNTGSVTTSGPSAHGIVALSAGGGGGLINLVTASYSTALGSQTTGDSGGGNGAMVTVSNSGSITTGNGPYGGEAAIGIVAQSIGGGGGSSGGGASYLGGLDAEGAGGGVGGEVNVTTSGSSAITTRDSQAIGILAQSVGGGGGNGANAWGVIAAVGGGGGSGGSGGTVNVSLGGSNSVVSTAGVYAAGVVAQSIGGGGGAGGSASSRSLALPSSDIPTISFDFAMGGTGGTGGDGGSVTIANTGSVMTAGDGAYGVAAQSIGAGGGAGGDSTAASYALAGAMPTINLDVSLGGSGGVGGSGGGITVTNGASTGCSGCAGTIATYGDNAVGLLAQSVGGGGGSGGTGNASASSASLGKLLSDGTGTSVKATAAVGGSGGSGNVGGTISVTNYAGSTITTFGGSSHGILAHSIGGGGGVAGGSSAGAGSGTLRLDVSVGGTGGNGNNGGAVTVINAGTISTGGFTTEQDGVVVTVGSDAVGILAQSIGGGGGVGGSSDPATTVGLGGQLINSVKALKDSGGSSQAASVNTSYMANLYVGGQGGAGGAGGNVTVTNSGSITTHGHRSYGIEAQSVGGGGGNGGSATSKSSSTWSTINKDLTALGNHALAAAAGKVNVSLGANVSLGGVAGSGSVSGTVSVSNTGSITTSGYGAHAILAQSIGGGGGTGGEGTTSGSTTLALGVGYSASGGYGNYGGEVTVTDAGTIVTAGDDAYGILAQTIGGGGGLAGAGCSNSSTSYASLGVTASQCLGNNGDSINEAVSAWTDSLYIGVAFRGSAGTNGDGNTVNIQKTGGGILTTGARAMGIVAQSIGGGGGLAVAGDSNIGFVSFESNSISGDGGEIIVGLDAGASVTTYGDGAWGIFAQSIGAGGGFFGDSSLTLSFANVNTLPQADGASVWGGNIFVTLAGDITTSGTNAHGVVLQTSGAGNSGGAGVDGMTVLGADLGSSQGVVYGLGGAISVQQTGGTIAASGANASGIVAQSIGSDTSGGVINISIAGTVQGGETVSWTSGGIVLSGGAVPGSGFTNSVTVQSGGTVTNALGVGGQAVMAFSSDTSLTNNGLLVGIVGLFSTGGAGADGSTWYGQPLFESSSTLTNNGTFLSGSDIIAHEFVNAGVLSIGGPGRVLTTSLTGSGASFSQTGTGTLIVDIDTRTSQGADLFQVEGSATLDGTIRPVASYLLPGSYTILQSNTDQGITLGPTLAGVTDGIFWRSIPIYWNYFFSSYNQEMMIAPNADFTNASVPLTTNETAFAAYLQRTWDAGGSDSLAPLYGALSEITSASAYAAALDDVAGETLSVHANDQALATRIGLDGAFSCPVFVGDGTLLGETSCVWGKAEGGQTRTGTRTDRPGYTEDLFTLRSGGQGEIAPGWFLGGSAAYSTTDANADGLGAGSDGKRIDASLAVKRVRDAWYVGLGANLGYGWYNNHRTVDIYGRSQPVTSDSNVFTAGARARVQYEIPLNQWYLRPRVDVDLLYTHVPSYGEDGPTGVTLDVRAQSETTLAFAPYLEIGGRFDFGDAWTLRPYAGFGLIAMTNDTWTTEASLIGAPSSAGTFKIESDVPTLLGQLDLGIQLTRFDAFEARLEYGLDLGDDYQSSMGSLRIGYEF